MQIWPRRKVSRLKNTATGVPTLRSNFLNFPQYIFLNQKQYKLTDLQKNNIYEALIITK